MYVQSNLDIRTNPVIENSIVFGYRIWPVIEAIKQDGRQKRLYKVRLYIYSITGPNIEYIRIYIYIIGTFYLLITQPYIRYPAIFPSGYRDFPDIEVRISRFHCIK
jgi:hypothetical protein